MAENSKIQWTDIPGHPGYVVSPQGDVGSKWVRRGLGRGRGTRTELSDIIRLLHPSTSAEGYLFLNLGRGNTRSVHRLVLETFVGPRPDGCEARHLNGNRADNRLVNLAWGTPAENHADQYAHGTRVAGERHPQSKIGPLHVRAVRALSDANWLQHDIADLFGIAQPTVSSIVNYKHRVTAVEEAA